MPTIKRSEVIKMNEKMENGFVFDVEQFCIWGEKQATKIIDIEENHLEVNIYYQKSTHAGEPVAYNMVLSFRLWKPTTTGCFCSTGIGHHYTISSGHQKKMFKNIQEATKKFPEPELLAMWNAIVNNPEHEKWGSVVDFCGNVIG